MAPKRRASQLVLCGKSPDSFNSVKNPDEVIPKTQNLGKIKPTLAIEISPHSVNIIKVPIG